MLKKSALIGGNGPSLANADLRRVPNDALVYRVNNFFLEKEYYLGRHIHCVYFSADKRALRFYLATLKKVIKQKAYDVDATASHHPRAAELAPPQPFTHFSVDDPTLQSLMNDYLKRYGVRPTSGIFAMVYAWQAGATDLYLSGIDFYAGPLKYHTPLPPRLNQILTPNLTESGYDTKLHARVLDEAIIAYLENRGVAIYRIDPTQETESSFPLAPICNVNMMRKTCPKRIQTSDWEPRSGWHSLAILVLLRKLRAWRRNGYRQK